MEKLNKLVQLIRLAMPIILLPTTRKKITGKVKWSHSTAPLYWLLMQQEENLYLEKRILWKRKLMELVKWNLNQILDMVLTSRLLIISGVKTDSSLNFLATHSNLINLHGLKQFEKVDRRTQLLSTIVWLVHHYSRLLLAEVLMISSKKARFMDGHLSEMKR